jgi:hypothetical protein
VYLGEAPYEVQVGDRRVKAVDPWRTGLLGAFVPGYALYWWYRSAADLQALANATRNDKARLNPVLMLVLVLFSAGFLPMILAVVLLSRAIKGAQEHEGTNARTSTLANVAALLLLWLVGPLLIVLVAVLGGSVGSALVALVLAVVISLALTAALFDELQFHLNSLWSSRREHLDEGLRAEAVPA